MSSATMVQKKTIVNRAAARTKPQVKTNTRDVSRVRPISAGDVPPRMTDKALADFMVERGQDAADARQLGALKDVFSVFIPGNTHEVAQTLAAILEGASPDEARVLRDALVNADTTDRLPSAPDDELSDDCRTAEVTGLGQGNRSEGRDYF